MKDILGFICLIAIIGSCTHPAKIRMPKIETGYPKEIETIFINRCAVAGCHNQASYQNAGGLLLDSWQHLFDGGGNGAVVIPYSPDYSSLLYFINTDSTLGIVASPTMPYSQPPLSKDEYLTIKNWVTNGAPDNNGNIPFASFPATRQKVYVVHQSCDMIAVIDAAKNVVMRYIPIGAERYPESPTYVRVSPNDGRYAFVSFWYNQKIYKVDTYSDSVVATVDLGDSFWSLIHISEDGQKILVSNGDNYNMLSVNTATLQVQTLTNNDFVSPRGIASNASFDTFFVTGQFGNTVYKFSNGYNKKISIDYEPLTTSSGNTPDPYDIIMSPDHSKYFLACEKSNEVRVMDAHSDTLITVIPVGVQPQGLAISKKQPYLFVTCMEDNVSLSGYKGSVYVINYNTLEVVKKIEDKFYQPHGITVNDKNNTIYIFSRNQNYNGPAPHHKGPCSGRNGYFNIYDMTTLAPVTNKRHELLVDPFVSDIRFR